MNITVLYDSVILNPWWRSRSLALSNGDSPAKGLVLELDPARLETQERYKLLIGGVVPRPIAWVSTISPGGDLNVAPFSFFSAVGSDPMLLSFCPANRADGREKDTLRNAAPVEEGGVGEFVVNVVGEASAVRMAVTAENLPPEESEFDLAGLTSVPSARVRPPRIAGVPLSFECRTLRVLRFRPGAPSGSNMVLGEVVHVYAEDGLLDERFRVDPARLQAIGRMGGRGYTRTRDRFELPFGRAALDES